MIAARQVIGGYCGDAQAHDIRRRSVGHDQGQAFECGGHVFVNGLGRDDHGIRIRHRVQSGNEEVIAVIVADQYQVGSRNPLKVRCDAHRIHRIVVDHLSVPTHHQGGVVDRVKNDLAVVSGQMIAGHEVCPTELERAIMAR